MNINFSLRRAFTQLRTLTCPDPERDWILLVTIAIVTIGCVIVWNAWIFDRVANGATINGRGATTLTKPRQPLIDSIHAVFTERAAKEELYRGQTYPYTDPSQ